MYQHTLTALPNRLRLVMIPMPQVESTTVMVGVGAGSRYETKRVNGLFHFLEHMAFKGTKKRPSALRISSEIDGVGGEFNAFTGKELTAYYIKLAAKHQELAFDILADMLQNSLFKAEEIEREKGVIVEEINMYEDTPMRRVLEVFIRLLYGDNAMGWSIAGKKESVRQLERQDFLDYIDRLYYPQNMVVAVSGKLDQAKVSLLMKSYFKGLREKSGKKAKPVKLIQKRSRVKLVTKKTEQAHFCLGAPGYHYAHPDRFTLGVLTSVLGGGMSSRLFIEVRERRGLAYYVSCMPDFFTDSGYLMARAGVRLEKIDEAVKVVLAEFGKLTAKKVAAKELKKAKEFVKGRMILALEDSQQVATRYAAQILLEKKIRTPKKTMALIDQVTADDIQRVAKDILKPEKLNLALIGPYKNETRFKKLLT